jgi:hypothetical protein
MIFKIIYGFKKKLQIQNYKFQINYNSQNSKFLPASRQNLSFKNLNLKFGACL